MSKIRANQKIKFSFCSCQFDISYRITHRKFPHFGSDICYLNSWVNTADLVQPNSLKLVILASYVLQLELELWFQACWQCWWGWKWIGYSCRTWRGLPRPCWWLGSSEWVGVFHPFWLHLPESGMTILWSSKSWFLSSFSSPCNHQFCSKDKY